MGFAVEVQPLVHPAFYQPVVLDMPQAFPAQLTESVMELIEFTASEEQFRITEVAMKAWVDAGQRDDLRVVFLLPEPTQVNLLPGLVPSNLAPKRGNCWVEYFVIPELAGTKEKVPLLNIETPTDRWLAGHGLFFRKVQVHNGLS